MNFRFTQWQEPVVPILQQVQSLGARLSLARNPHLDAREGFLLSEYSVQSLTEILADGGTLYGFQNLDGSLVAYCLRAPAKSFFCRHSETEATWNVPEVRKRFTQRDFTYLDQIAVSPAYQGNGLAKKLVLALVNQTPGLILTAVMKEPAANPRSFGFFAKEGFQEVGEFFTPHLRGVNGVLSAVMARNY